MRLRNIAVGLGILIGLLLLALLTLPQLLLASALQERLLARLEQLLDRPVSVRGDAGLSLLPRPRISLDQVVIAGPPAGGARFRLEVDRIDVDLGLLALLGAAPEPRQLRLVRPRLELWPGAVEALAAADAAGRPLPALPDRLIVLDGTLVLHELAPAASVTLAETELDYRRRGSDGGLVSFAAALAGERLEAEATLTGIGTTLGSDLDLTLTLGEGSGRSSLAYRGRARPGPPGARLAGAMLHGEAGLRLTDPVAWTRLMAGLGLDGAAALPAAILAQPGGLALEGRIERRPEQLLLDDLRLELAAGTITGRVRQDPVLDAGLDIALDGERLRLSPDLLGAARALAGLLAGRAPPASRLALHLAAPAWQERPIDQLRLDLVVGDQRGLRLERGVVDLPDGSELRLEGDIGRPDADPSAELSLRLTTPGLRGLLPWLGVDAAALPATALADAELGADLSLAAGAITLRRAELRVDGGRATGSIAWQGGARDRIAAMLTIERLALDRYWPAGAAPEQLVALLPADLDAAVDLTLEAPSWGEIRAARAHGRMTLEQGLLTVSELGFSDLAEASGRLVGTARPADGTLDLALEAEAPRPARLFRLAGIEPPPQLQRFQPAQLSGTLRGTPGQRQLELELALPGLDLRLASRQPDLLAFADGDLELVLDAADLPDILRRLGMGPVGAGEGLAGPLHVEVRTGAESGGARPLELVAAQGASRLQASLRLGRAGEVPRLSGRLHAERLQLDLVRLLQEVMSGPLGLLPPAPASWIGRWPTTPLTWRWLYQADLDLALAAASIQAGGQELGSAAATLRLEDGRLDLVDLDLPLAGGRLEGALRIDGRAVVPAATAKLALRGADVAELLAALGPPTALAGRLDLALDLATAGLDPAALVRNLAGSGRMMLVDGVVEGASLDPVPDPIAVPRLPLRRLAGPLAIEAGFVHGGPDGLALDLDTGPARLRLDLDLLAWIVTGRIEATAGVPPPVLAFAGPPWRVRGRLLAPVSPTGPASAPAVPTP